MESSSPIHRLLTSIPTNIVPSSSPSSSRRALTGNNRDSNDHNIPPPQKSNGYFSSLHISPDSPSEHTPLSNRRGGVGASSYGHGPAWVPKWMRPYLARLPRPRHFIRRLIAYILFLWTLHALLSTLLPSSMKESLPSMPLSFSSYYYGQSSSGLGKFMPSSYFYSDSARRDKVRGFGAHSRNGNFRSRRSTIIAAGGAAAINNAKRAAASTIGGESSQKGTKTEMEYQHPIPALMEEAKKTWEKKLRDGGWERARTYEEGVREYRRRYGLASGVGSKGRGKGQAAAHATKGKYVRMTMSPGVRSERGKWGDPPKGFDKWWKFARSHNILLPSAYDSLTEALALFRSLSAAELRERTYSVAALPSFSLVEIDQEGEVLLTPGGLHSRDVSSIRGSTRRAQGFKEMLESLGREVLKEFSGLAFAYNELAEPRVLLDHKQKEDLHAGYMPPPSDLDRTFPSADWRGSGGVWDSYVSGCSPGSAARRLMSEINSNAQPEFSFSGDLGPVAEHSPLVIPPKSKRRSLQRDLPPLKPTHEDGDTEGLFNLTMKDTSPVFASSTSPRDVVHSNVFRFANSLGISTQELCSNPDIHKNHGAFFSDWRTLNGLYPVFSHSKVAGFMDVAVPSNWYYSPPKHYLFDESAGVIPFADRKDQIFWRGSTTGGGNNPPRHQHSFQRHRFMRLASVNNLPSKADVLTPSKKGKRLVHQSVDRNALNEKMFNVAFTRLSGCGDAYTCNVTRALPLYRFASAIPFSDSHAWKLLLDIDGQAYSGRFLSLLMMGSAVMKSTLYEEYFSDHLVPWYHVIPVSFDYEELPNIYSYFLGVPPLGQDTRQAVSRSLLKRWKQDHWEGDRISLQKIAEQGREWSSTVGNKATMEAYVYRLCLEWKRLWFEE